MTRWLLCVVLFAVGCSAETGRSGYAGSDGEPVTQPTDVSPGAAEEPSCVPVTCDVEVAQSSLDYFTAPSCQSEARLLPLAPGDQVAYETLCTRQPDGTVRVWVTAGRSDTPSQVWGGDGCRELPGMVDGFEWWNVVELDSCD